MRIKNICLTFCLSYFVALTVYAADFVVTVTTDTNPAGGGVSGDLRNALTQLSLTGTTGEGVGNNNIYLQVPNNSTINVGTSGANWPVITNGVSICYSTDGTSCASTGSGQVTISGATSASATIPAASIFRTSDASLSLVNVALKYGLAQGGTGASVNAGGGGGGGLGAGGGVFIDAGEQLILANVEINNCSVVGGTGGNGGNASAALAGGGGGASWSSASSNASNGTGGGDYPGANPDPNTTTFNVLSGYGGGNGGTGNVGTGGTGGGNSFGLPNASGGTNTSGGIGGYSGGGGGSGPNGGGGGGGNPGGYGNVVSGSTGGGAGGSYGSGGGGGSQVAGLNTASGGGGGGGFGGGGGGAGGTNSVSAGGGGGGFGAGGGGGGVTANSAGNGGNFGGDGGSAIQASGGGGGGALGGGIFVSDSATLIIGDSVLIPDGGNSLTAGVAGSGGGATDGTAYATDIFLFQNASVQFVGSNGYSGTNAFASAIQSDTTVGAVADDGVLINTETTSTVINLSSTNNNYRGGTNIQQGILEVGSTNIPTVGDINIQANGTLYLTSSYTPSVAITNAGALNITSGTFTIPTTFTNSGNIYLINTGNIVGNITSGSSLNIGKSSTDVTGSNAFSTVNAITVTSVNVYNTSSLTTIGGSISANLYMLGTSTYSGSNIAGSKLTIGVDSFDNEDVATAFTAQQAITNADFPTINITNGSFSNAGFNITPTSMNVYNSSVLTSTGGAITTNLYMLGTSTFSGANISGGILSVGVDSTGSTDSNTAFVAQQTISGFPTINVSAGSMSTGGFAVSNVNNAFTIADSAVATFDAVVAGTAPLTVNGTLTNAVTNGIGLSGLITNTGTINVNQNLALSNTVDNSGTINVANGVNFTINGNLFLFDDATIEGNLNGGGGSTVTIGQDSLGTNYTSTDATINGAMNGIPNLNVLNGGISITSSVTGLSGNLAIASNASANFSSTVAGGATVNNAGSLTASGQINVSTYTSTGTTNLVITDDTTFGRVVASGAVSLGTIGINVTSNFTTAIAGNTYTWSLVDGTSVTPNPVNASIPPDTIANTWTLSQTANNISIQLVKGELDPDNAAIGAVIRQISQNPVNTQQFTLVDSLGLAPTQTDLNNFVNELIPDLNSAVVNVRKQDAIFSQVWQRINAVRTNVAMHSVTGVTAGDISYNHAAWLGGFLSSADQNPYDNNFGYRAYSGGVILGLDTMFGSRDLVGVAFARSSTNIQTKLDPGLNTRTIGYHGLLYGNHDFGQNYDYFLEWMLSGAYNDNTGNRRILITNSNFSTSAKYHDWQGGILFNYGKVWRYNKCLNINPKACLQYNFIDIPSYDEIGDSPAALHVDNNRWRDVLMLGIGSELAFNVQRKYFAGRPSITAIIGYDVISTKEITTANFLAGGGPFTFVGAPARVSFTLGLDCTFQMNNYTELQFLYDLQLRSGYIANAGTAKLRVFLYK